LGNLVSESMLFNLLKLGWSLSFFGSVLFSFSNLFLKLCHHCGYSHGLLSDYLIPKLYLTDILVTFTLIFSVAIFLKKTKYFDLKKLNFFIKSSFFSLELHQAINLIKKHLAILTLFLIWVSLGILQLNTLLPIIGVLQWLRLSSYFLLGLFLAHFFNNSTSFQNIITEKKVFDIFQLAITIGVIFQALLGVYQWHWQKNFAGYLFFGEPLLNGQPGLATKIQNGVELLLPYGSTAHPNVLAGLTVLSLIGLISLKNKGYQNHFFGVTLISGLILIYLTQSVSASLAVVLTGIYFLAKQLNFKLFSNKSKDKIILLGFLAFTLILIGSSTLTLLIGIKKTDQPSWYRRAYLIESSQELMASFSWVEATGVGLGQYTLQAPLQVRAYEFSRFNQPVHHIPLLLIAETGVLGLVFFVVSTFFILQKLLLSSTKKVIYQQAFSKLAGFLLILTPLLTWDHYLYSIPPTTAMLVMTGTIFVFAPKKIE
jgi:hypothetical protein